MRAETSIKCITFKAASLVACSNLTMRISTQLSIAFLWTEKARQGSFSWKLTFNNVTWRKQVVTVKEHLRAFQEFQPIEKGLALWWVNLDHQASQEVKKTSGLNSENEFKMRSQTHSQQSNQ